MKMINDSLLRIINRLEGYPLDTCWLWTGYIQGGYGRAYWKGENIRVHRIVYAELVDTVPVGFELHHKCANKHCANPSHLEIMTKSDHSRISPALAIMASKNRSRTHCSKGHEWTKENTLWYTYKNKTGRRCRKCHVVQETKYRRRKKEKLL